MAAAGRLVARWSGPSLGVQRCSPAAGGYGCRRQIRRSHDRSDRDPRDGMRGRELARRPKKLENEAKPGGGREPGHDEPVQMVRARIVGAAANGKLVLKHGQLDHWREGNIAVRLRTVRTVAGLRRCRQSLASARALASMAADDVIAARCQRRHRQQCRTQRGGRKRDTNVRRLPRPAHSIAPAEGSIVVTQADRIGSPASIFTGDRRNKAAPKGCCRQTGTAPKVSGRL